MEAMKKVRLPEVGRAVRRFLGEVLESDGVVIEDEDGRVRGEFVAYRDPTAAEERRADESVKRLWQHTSQAMKETGVTEEDIDRDLQEGD